MASADVEIAKYLTKHGYHPRSSRHGDAICEFLLSDLLASCESLRQAAVRDRIVYDTNFTVDPTSVDSWNADLVMGPPAHAPEPKAKRSGPTAKGEPDEIWLAIDAKTIMTEHGKARRNRQRDLNAFQDMLHRKNAKTIVGGLLLVNIAERFLTPLARKAVGATEHKNIKRLVAETVSMMEALGRSGPNPGVPGLEALGIIVVSHTNVPGEQTSLVVDPPAPNANAPSSYSSFLRDTCLAFSARFGS